MNKQLCGWSSLLIGLGIILGAMGAHALEEELDTDQLESFKTGVFYHLFHALALLIIGLKADLSQTYFKWPVRLFIAGIVLFSGSIYLLATKDLTGIGSFTKILGPITPIGGLLLIIGWTLAGLQFFKRR